MCTVIIINDPTPEIKLLVASNRDENYTRPSMGPQFHPYPRGRIIRPWDLQAAGTWFGVADDGWFVTLTNQDDEHHIDSARSRGYVVNECLATQDHATTCRFLKSLDVREYNPFNLVFGRPGAVFVCRVLEGHELELEPLLETVNVISNDCWGSRYDVKLDRIRELISKLDMRTSTIVRDIFSVMSDHGCEVMSDQFQAPCVHSPNDSFGTVSTSIVTVSNNKSIEYWYSEGNPCSSKGLVLSGQF